MAAHGVPLYFHRAKHGKTDVQFMQQLLAELPALNQLPIEPVTLVGRQDTIAQCMSLINAVLQDQRPNFVIALTGDAGVGKTTLALHLAHRLKSQFEVQYFDFRGTPAEPLDPNEALAQWRPDAAAPRSLLVLDNVDHVAQVEPLLRDSQSALITSRKPLTALDQATILLVPSLTESEAQELLQQIVGTERKLAEPNAIAKLVEQCDRLPLAMRLAGSVLVQQSQESVRHYLNQLSDEKTQWQSRTHAATIRSTFTLSYAALTPTAAQLLRLIGLLAETAFTAAQAAVLLKCDRETARSAIQELVAFQFVIRIGKGRYCIVHDLVRLWTRTQLAIEETAATRAAVRLRLCQWYADASEIMAVALETLKRDALLKPQNRDVEQRRAVEVLNWFETERLNLLAVIGWADQAQAWELVLRLVENLNVFFDQRTYRADWQPLLMRALSAAEQVNDRFQAAQVLNALGNVYLRQELWQKAEEHYKQSLARFSQLGDSIREAQTLTNLGVLYAQQDQPQTTIPLWQSALEKLPSDSAEHKVMQRWMQSIDADSLQAAGGDLTERSWSKSVFHDFTAALKRFILE